MGKHAGWRPLADEEQQEIVKRYNAGETIRTLRTEYRRTRQTIKDVLLAAGATLRPPGYGKGREWTPEWREAHKRASQTPEFRQKSREALLRRLPSMRGPATNTPIEQRLRDAFMKAGIGFTTQSLLLERYLVDFELHQARVVVEADGAQHALRDRKLKDAERDAELADAGYRVFRFTGSQINRDALECVQSVVGACCLTPESEPVYEIRTRFAGPDHPRWKGGPAEFTCAQCSVTFAKPRQHRTGERTFCTQECYGDWLREHPDEASSVGRRVQRDWSDLAALYASGMSTKQLAKHYGCGQPAILKTMRRLGIPVRQQGGYRPQGGSGPAALPGL
jgi:very-short-patch-repair endonuclease/Mor family transcriptional regulator